MPTGDPDSAVRGKEFKTTMDVILNNTQDSWVTVG